MRAAFSKAIRWRPLKFGAYSILLGTAFGATAALAADNGPVLKAIDMSQLKLDETPDGSRHLIKRPFKDVLWAIAFNRLIKCLSPIK